MDVGEIVKLVNLVSAKDISELEVEREGFRIRIVKAKALPGPAASDAERGLPPAIAVERVGGTAHEAGGSARAGAGASAEADLHVMKSPIIGTFYRSPSPTAEPYVKVGDRVKKGQVICIVEAMKLMNEIESEVSGVVVEVLIEDGHPVEYGEPLFKLRTEK